MPGDQELHKPQSKIYWQTENLLMYLVLNSDDNCRTGVTIEIDANIQIGHNFFFTSSLKYFDIKESRTYILN